MKKKIRNGIFLIAVLFLAACKFNDHSISDVSESGQLKKNQTLHDKNVGSIVSTSEFKTQTGKIITVTQIQSIGRNSAKVIVSTQGFKENRSIEIKGIDPIEKMELKDLDKNNFEELYIFTRSIQSGNKGDFYVYASNKDENLVKCEIEKVGQEFEEEGALDGYMGHDIFFFEKEFLLMQFPVYEKVDLNSVQTMRIRKICYNLNHSQMEIVSIE